MRNMAVLHSPAFSYPLPVLVRVLSNLLIFKGKILYYNKYKKTHPYTNVFEENNTSYDHEFYRKKLVFSIGKPFLTIEVEPFGGVISLLAP